jgi:hypothetical protein
LEFVIPGDNESYVDPNIKLYISGKVIKEDGTSLSATDYTTGVNNQLHSLFSQCTITLNGIQITQASDLYNYRAYVETLLTHGTDAADSHLKMAFWQLDEGNMVGEIAQNPTKRRMEGLSLDGKIRK